jgi:hypothetical protein
MGGEADRMWEKCAVDLRVNLPRSVAEDVAEVQKRDPELMSRLVMYAFTRRTIFDHLALRTSWGGQRTET